MCRAAPRRSRARVSWGCCESAPGCAGDPRHDTSTHASDLSGSHQMNTKQIALIHSSFEQLAPAAEQLAAAFYRRLFELDPTLQPLFQHDIALQGRKFMTMLAVVVRGLDALDRLLPDVENLARRHVAYGVSDTQYQIVEVALLWTIQEHL